jgi:hypothetical protein
VFVLARMLRNVLISVRNVSSSVEFEKYFFSDFVDSIMSLELHT